MRQHRLLNDVFPVAWRHARVLAFGLLATFAAGCAGVHLPKTITDGDVTPRRKTRNEEVTRHFEKQRDFAEFEAARVCWIQHRDAQGCREALEKLLARNPEHREARLLMAELPPADDLLDEMTGECVAVAHTAPLPPATAATGSRDGVDSADPSEDADDDRAGTLLRQGRIALANGSPQTTLDYYRQAVATEPDNPQIPISAAASLLRANRPRLAIELLTPVAKRHSSSAAVHRMLGVAHYRTGDYRSSQVALQKALSLDKSSALSYLLIGCTLAKLGQGEAAEAHFRQARTLDPKYRVVR